MRVLLANPRGFCAGVDRAIAIVERALELFAAPIYVRHEVVHNRFVVEGLKARGAIFVEELDEVPRGAIVIFSAHGVAQSVREEAKLRELQVFDATCPLVTKVHMEVARASRKNAEVVLIGHAGHPEVNGTMGQYASTQGAIYLIETVEDVAKLQVKQPDNLYFVSQTTLSIDETQAIVAALRAKFANIQGPHKDDICYATQNRQDAVRELALHSDVVIVVGSKNSSNSNRLRELAQKMGVPAYLVDQAQDVDGSWLQGCAVVGVTAGASAPQPLVELIIERIKALGATYVEELTGKEEKMVFELPKELQIKQLS
ncbi:MAG: 4-hydroxy-3-methylbut-2-enyl diphosphate reductase [Enterovibrio sp.]